MFIILREKTTNQLVGRNAEDGWGDLTNDLQKAKLFKLDLYVDYLVLETAKATTGEVTCKLEEKFPAGLIGEYEIVPVDLRLA